TPFHIIGQMASSLDTTPPIQKDIVLAGSVRGRFRSSFPWTKPRPMQIAFDLRYAADHFAGIGRHAFCLFEALLELPGPERYTALWNPALAITRFDLEPVRRHPRVTWVEKPFGPLAPPSLWQVGGWLREPRPS